MEVAIGMAILVLGVLREGVGNFIANDPLDGSGNGVKRTIPHAGSVIRCWSIPTLDFDAVH